MSEVWKIQNVSLSPIQRIELFKEQFKGVSFNSQDYLQAFKEISAPTASRDLKEATDLGLIERQGDKRTTNYIVINLK